MTAATATLVHTSSREAAARVSIARVAAAGRIEAARLAKEAREAREHAETLAAANAWVEELIAAGADRVGFKICFAEGGKWRTRMSIWAAAEFLARRDAGDEIEAWGLNQIGEYVGTAW